MPDRDQERLLRGTTTITFDFKAPPHVLIEMLKYLTACKESLFDQNSWKAKRDHLLELIEQRDATREAIRKNHGLEELSLEETQKLSDWSAGLTGMAAFQDEHYDEYRYRYER